MTMKQLIFLDGESGTDHRDTFDKLSRHFNCMLFDELYSKPEKLAALKFLNPEYIFIGTTGMMREKLDVLEDLFTEIGWTPNGVIFASENSAMAMLHMTSSLKKKGTKFYYNYEDNGNLEEICWI